MKVLILGIAKVAMLDKALMKITIDNDFSTFVFYINHIHKVIFDTKDTNPPAALIIPLNAEVKCS